MDMGQPGINIKFHYFSMKKVNVVNLNMVNFKSIIN